MSKIEITAERHDDSFCFRLPTNEKLFLYHHSRILNIPAGEFVRNLIEIGLEEYLEDLEEYNSLKRNRKIKNES